MKTQRIGLVIHHTLHFYREILRGIRNYGRQKPNWILIPILPDTRSVRSKRCAQCAGLVCHASTVGLVEAIEELAVPWVNVSSVLPQVSAPRVMVDHRAVGHLAAEYFLDRGYRSFAYVGYRDHLFSMQREAGYRERVEQAGCRVEWTVDDAVPHGDPSGLQHSGESLNAWLKSLPTLTAAFSSNDVQGFQVTEACREAGINVPEQLSLIAVDNDDLLCDLSRPPLSSVALPTQQIGYEAARLLDRLMRGTKPPVRPKLLAPVGIVERASSSMLAIEDRLVAEALRFIRENTHRIVAVNDVLAAVSVSRRLLERRFRAVLGRTLGAEICHRRLENSKQLLVDTDLSIAEVARAAGFSDGKHFATVFRRELKSTPTEYRRRCRCV